MKAFCYHFVVVVNGEDDHHLSLVVRYYVSARLTLPTGAASRRSSSPLYYLPSSFLTAQCSRTPSVPLTLRLSECLVCSNYLADHHEEDLKS